MHSPSYNRNKARYKPKQEIKLPFNFNLYNYDGAKNLTAREWYYQLAIRTHAKMFMWNEYFKDDIKEDLENIEQTGIVPYEEELARSYDELFKYNPAEDACVKFITLDEITKIHNDFSKDKSKAMFIHNFPSLYLSINLFASDTELKTKFRTAIKKVRDHFTSYKSKREERSIKKYTHSKFTEKDFPKWTDNRMLPYIDLKLLSAAHNHRLTKEQIARTIFPEKDIADIAFIYDTIQPLYNYLTSFIFLVKFRYYITNQNSHNTKQKKIK